MTVPALPRGPVINAATGGMMPQWIAFFDALRLAITGTVSDTTTSLTEVESDIATLNAQVAELLSDTEPDAELEARLALVEADYLFTGSNSSASVAALQALDAQITGLASDLAQAALESQMAADATAALGVVRRRLDALEVIAALSEPNETMMLRNLRRQVADLETVAAFE